MAQKTVTRADLAEAVYESVGLSRTESAQLVERFLNLASCPCQASQTQADSVSVDDRLCLPDQIVGVSQGALGLVQHVHLDIDVAELDERILNR